MSKNKRKQEEISESCEKERTFVPSKKKQKLTKDFKPPASNFHRHIISSDGNCLYRAILYSFFQDDKDHYQLRLDVCEHIYQNKIEYGPWLFHELDVQDIDQYIQNMKINGI